MSQPLLFNTTPFSLTTTDIDAKVRRGVELLTSSNFTSKTSEEVATDLYNLFKLLPLAILTGSIYQHEPQDVPVEVLDEIAPQGTRLVMGARFSFFVPFTGKEDLLQTKPITTNGVPPFGTLTKEKEINFTLEHTADGNPEDLLIQYQDNLGSISGYTTLLNQNIETYNASLQQLIIELVTARRAQLDKKYADAEVFGVPIV